MRCSVCGKDVVKVRLIKGMGVCHTCLRSPRGDAPGFHTFKPMWYRDLAEEPIFIESKKQLVEECKRRGLVSARFYDQTDIDSGDLCYEFHRGK